MYHFFGKSRYAYSYPVASSVPAQAPNLIGHLSTSKHLHFEVANPTFGHEEIYAPAPGKIIEIVQRHDAVLPIMPNRIVVASLAGEYWEISHFLADSCDLHVGYEVYEGQRLALTGHNGYVDTLHGERWRVSMKVFYLTFWGNRKRYVAPRFKPVIE